MPQGVQVQVLSLAIHFSVASCDVSIVGSSVLGSPVRVDSLRSRENSLSIMKSGSEAAPCPTLAAIADRTFLAAQDSY